MKRIYQKSRKASYLCAAAWLGMQFSAMAVLPNPEFLDEDGDGVPDGWEVKNFILEKYRGVSCLGLKFLRHDNSSVEGEVSTVFQAAEGFYRVTISYLDEYDGVSKGKFLVNDQIQRIWNFDNTFGDFWRDEIIENVELKPGDKITLLVRDNPSEFGRIRSIQIEPSPTPPTAQELEERRNPPVIEDKDFGPLVALRDVRDLSEMQRWPETDPLLSTRFVQILLLKNAGEKVALEVIPNSREAKYTVKQHDPSATTADIMGAGNDFILEEKLPFDAANPATTLTLPEDLSGLLELQIASESVRSETPYVILTQTGAAEKQRGGASRAFYFFVPKGTTAFGVGAYSPGRTVEVTLYAPDRSLVTKMDVQPTQTQGLPIRVRPGQDDGVWTLVVSGVSPTIRLVGIPPYLATHPRLLLVPQETVNP